MQALSRRHETFARNLSHSISAYLRIQFQAAASAEYLTYGQFLQGIPPVRSALRGNYPDVVAEFDRIREGKYAEFPVPDTDLYEEYDLEIAGRRHF